MEKQNTTDFEIWLEAINTYEIDDIFCLYECVRNRKDYGMFKCTTNNGIVFISTDDSDMTLLLATDKAVTAFLNTLDHKFGGDFGNIYGNYEFIKGMRKDD